MAEEINTIQVLIDLCHVHGWVAVHVTRAAGSGMKDGHVHVFYRDLYGDAHAYMLFPDERGVQQLADLVEKAKSRPIPFKTKQRYSFGFTDTRGIFGTTV